ncbi:MAG TPA: pyridoxal phosphate-dependent aminotransferase, partial [bacterium]|nr:pyridoxal phosphate-dependent aminotransferase [bacterium]
FILVNPNNPTGNYLSQEDQAVLSGFLNHGDLAYISDEVFFDFSYPGTSREPWTPLGCLSFRLGGLSKSLGLPQLKLSWIVLGGPPEQVLECRERLELIADSYLSVNGPVQGALPELLQWAPEFRAQVLERVMGNRRILERAIARSGFLRLWPAQGGWYALVEIRQGSDRWENDALIAIELSRKEGVLTHPGGFYDLTGGKFLVLSLLPTLEVFQEGIERMIRFFSEAALRT